jgi:hypothetical protein
VNSKHFLEIGNTSSLTLRTALLLCRPLVSVLRYVSRTHTKEKNGIGTTRHHQVVFKLDYSLVPRVQRHTPATLLVSFSLGLLLNITIKKLFTVIAEMTNMSYEFVQIDTHTYSRTQQYLYYTFLFL